VKKKKSSVSSSVINHCQYCLHLVGIKKTIIRTERESLLLSSSFHMVEGGRGQGVDSPREL
jgi:hypothetical protein